MKFKTKPWEHQLKALEFVIDKPGAGIFLEMGVGKTKVAIDVIVNRGHQRILTVCPKRVMDVWPREVATHSDGINVVVLTGTLKKRTEVMKTYTGTFPVMFVTNYEAVWQEPVKTALKRMKFDLIILDEAHHIKSAGGKASRHMHTMSKIVPWRLALTGTPTPQSPLDAYGVYRFIDQSIFGVNFDKFKERYCIENKFNYSKTYINQEELSDKMYTVAYRALSRDVLDLPESREQNYEFDMSPEAMRVYKILEKESVLITDTSRTAVNNSLAQYTRLHQMTSGYMPDGFGGDLIIDTNKKLLFADILEDIPLHEPIVVFARFVEDLDNIKEVCKKQGRACSEVSGRSNGLQKWKEGETDVVAVQIQSGAEGEDYTRSHYAIYYSLGFSLGDYVQSRARIDRPGQNDHPVFIHLLAKNTIDIKIMSAIKAGKQIVDYLNDEYRIGGQQ